MGTLARRQRLAASAISPFRLVLASEWPSCPGKLARPCGSTPPRNDGRAVRGFDFRRQLQSPRGKNYLFKALRLPRVAGPWHLGRGDNYSRVSAPTCRLLEALFGVSGPARKHQGLLGQRALLQRLHTLRRRNVCARSRSERVLPPSKQRFDPNHGSQRWNARRSRRLRNRLCRLQPWIRNGGLPRTLESHI